MDPQKNAVDLFEVLRVVLDNGSDELMTHVRRDLDQIFIARTRDEELQMASTAEGLKGT